MKKNWKSKLISKTKHNLKPRNIFLFLTSSPFKSSLTIALIFSFFATNARFNGRWDMVGLEAPSGPFNTPNAYIGEDDYYEYIPPKGTLCADIGKEASTDKDIILDAYLRDYIYYKYPNFNQKTDSEQAEIIMPIFENIGLALENACKREATKIAPKGWWYVFFMTTIANMFMITLGRAFYDSHVAEGNWKKIVKKWKED